ncbi:hypothetical protein GHT06_014167 [Daphnia sinensis]|uniref:Protein transport protein Sec31A n=1 Tax=Daphnia sinensis TaxID=1820382 RepID=A0AAD5LCI2_9CRUS|nr:hypothetical protein GHT06_014167 [Daphnia sinensis]
MKIKEVEQTANIAWSPASQYPIYLATGTAAQQLDASFSTTSQIDLYSLDLNEPGPGMGLKASISTKQRFHKLVWGSQGISSGENPGGVIVGGADQGHILLFDAEKLLLGKNDETGGYLLADSKKHSGAVKALDFNPFQLNLLASGAAQSEIYIWDLNSPAAPMTPGTLSQPPDDVTCLAWNRQVQHILASTFATRCVVWDLRKNEPIIKVSDSTSRMRCKAVAWHPKVATQLCLASEEDQLPVIQLWDLRQATAPVNTFEGHQRGILAMDWCPQDPDLLLSCGKDNRVLIWNPNSPVPRGELLCELSTSSQWCFDTAWCPRNPSCIATASFDGHVRVHSIMGGREMAVQPTVNMIADSFPGMDSAPALQPPQQQIIVHEQLKKAPKWIRPVCGASFAFGGKLITFGLDAAGSAPSATPQVHISQVVTENELSLRSKELESALSTGNLAEFCVKKIESSGEHKEAWNFLAANFSPAPRQQLLHLLNYEPHSISEDGVVDSFDGLGVSDTFDSIAAEVKTFTIPTDQSTDGKISKALITGNLAAAVDLCFNDKRYADAIVLAMTGPPELLTATRDRYFRLMQGDVPRLIQAVVTRDWEKIVQHCDMSNWKEALAATLTYAEDAQFANLCQTIGQRLEAEMGATNEAVLCYICAGNMEKVVDCWLRVADDSTTSLQEMVEQVMVLRQAQQHWGRQPVAVNSGHLTQQLCRYAGLLAGQGSLEAALTYLDMSKDDSMVELKDRLKRALNPNERKVSTGMANGAYNSAPHQQKAGPAQRYPSVGLNRSSTPTNSYYGHQDQFNSAPAIPSYPPKPTTPFQSSSWATPSSTYNSPQSAPLMPPMLNTPAPPPAAQPLQQFYQPQSAQPQNAQPSPQFHQPTPPPPPASSVAPPPTTGNVSRLGSLNQRNRVYVQDPSVSSGRPGGYYNSASNSQFQQVNQMGYMPQQPQSSSAMFQPTGQFTSPSPYAQQGSFPGNQFSQPIPPSPGSFQLQSGQLANGIGMDNVQQPASLYTPIDHVQAPQQQSAFMQPSTFDAPPSITPPPASNLLPSVPLLPATSAPPGWNDPPPLTSFAKVKAEPTTVETINHPMGIVEQPAVPIIQPFDGLYNPGMASPVEPTQNQSHAPEPIPVQPAQALLPIPNEHQIIHDVFHTLKNKCAALATNAQLKRKLDDVGKKLECLDDLLRKNMLLSPTLLGLHQIVQAVQAFDYATSLSLHSQVVINTPFTEIGSFISGLKVLLQMAQQLGVQYQ